MAVDPGLAALAKLPPEVQAAFQKMNQAGITNPQQLQQAAARDPYTPISSTIAHAPAPVSTTAPRPVSPITGNAVGTSPTGQPLTGRYNQTQQEAFRSDPNNQQVIQQIRDAAVQRYGMATDYTVLGLANKVQNEGYSLPQVMEMLQQGYGYEGNPNLRRAADLTAIEYDPQQNALQRLLDESSRQYQLGVNTENIYGQRADKDLQSIYSDLSKALGTNAQVLRGIYQSGAQGIEGGYDRALQAATGASTDQQTRLMELAAQLGLGDALQGVLPQNAQELAFDTQGITQDRGNALANINTLGTQQQAISQKGIADSQRELAQSRGNVVQQVLGSIGKLGLNYGAEQRDLRGQLADIGGQRGAALRLAYEDAIHETDDRARQQKLDALSEEIQRGSLALQQGQLDLSRQELDLNKQGQSFDQSLQLQQLQLQKQQLAQQMNSGGLTEYERGQLQFKYDELDAKINGLIGGGSGASHQYGGAVGLDQFFNQERPEWAGGEPGAGPVFRGAVYGIVQNAWDGSGGDAGIAYQNALAQLSNPAYANQNPELLRQAIDIAFKKF